MTHSADNVSVSKQEKAQEKPTIVDRSGEDTSPQTAITQGQAEAILADLKVVKQRLFWVLVIVGFFAARDLFFHY